MAAKWQLIHGLKSAHQDEMPVLRDVLAEVGLLSAVVRVQFMLEVYVLEHSLCSGTPVYALEARAEISMISSELNSKRTSVDDQLYLTTNDSNLLRYYEH